MNTIKRRNKNQLTRAREAFLKALEASGIVTEAAAAALLHNRRLYEMRTADPDFAKRWDEALEVAYDRMEREAWRRAVEGWDEPIFQQGVLVGHVRRHSDKLLEVLLRGNRPAKFRQPMVEISAQRTVLTAYFHHERRPEAEPRVIDAEPERAAITHQGTEGRQLAADHQAIEAELEAMNSTRPMRQSGGERE